jgi:hypothetical protein
MATEGMSDDVFVILSQIFGAFAHGAEGLSVDREVILQARTDYTPVVTEFAKRWPKVEQGVLKSARLMGRLAAELASGRGGLITRADYQKAREIIIASSICPFRHPKDYA